MIKFFRKIRQQLLSENRVVKYLLYAIGEIVLVVIGILIALWVNNWNEDRKKLNDEYELLVNLQKDFGRNKKLIDEGRIGHQVNAKYNSFIVQFTGPVSTLETCPLDSIQRINYTIVELVFGSINPTFNPNRLELIQSNELRGKIPELMVLYSLYKEAENSNRDLALDLRRVHQKHVWLSDNINQSHSDYLGLIRDKEYHNLAIDREGLIGRCLFRLDNIESLNNNIINILEEELKRFD